MVFTNTTVLEAAKTVKATKWSPDCKSFKSKHFIATHAYVINSKFLKAYIDFYANYSTDAEEWITNDWAIRNHFLESKDFVCYSPCPQICAIKPTISDNSGLSDDDIEIRLTNTFYTYFDDYE